MEWVQGMRATDSSSSHALDWRELLFRRLSGHLLGIPSGTKTIEAEKALDLGQNVYYYIGRCVPRFGAHAVAHDPQQSVTGVSLASSPFDTGGLFHNHVALRSKMDASKKSAFVHKHTFADLSYVMPMFTWIETSFTQHRDYINGARPSSSCVPTIDLDNSESPAWTWEGRVLVDDYAQPPLPPVKIFMREHEYSMYTHWLPYQVFLSDDDAFDHLDKFDSLVEVVESPAESMKLYLCKKVEANGE